MTYFSAKNLFMCTSDSITAKRSMSSSFCLKTSPTEHSELGTKTSNFPSPHLPMPNVTSIYILQTYLSVWFYFSGKKK